MNITFDAATRDLIIDAEQAKPWGADLSCRLVRHGQTVPLAGVRFGATIKADGVIVAQPEWPKPGVSLHKTDQDVLEVKRVRWVTGQQIEFYAWVWTPTGRVEVTEIFEAPQVPSPYPSWIWEMATNSWVAPVPMPDDGGQYVWNEADGAWEVE